MGSFLSTFCVFLKNRVYSIDVECRIPYRVSIVNYLVEIYVHTFFKKILIYFWLYWLFIAVRGCSLVVACVGHPLVAVHKLLIAAAFLVVVLGLRSCGTQV